MTKHPLLQDAKYSLHSCISWGNNVLIVYGITLEGFPGARKEGFNHLPEQRALWVFPWPSEGLTSLMTSSWGTTQRGNRVRWGGRQVGPRRGQCVAGRGEHMSFLAWREGRASLFTAEGYNGIGLVEGDHCLTVIWYMGKGTSSSLVIRSATLTRAMMHQTLPITQGSIIAIISHWAGQHKSNNNDK